VADIASNRKAGRDYHFLEKYEAGIALKGTEVKSIRLGFMNLNDAFARVDHGQAFLYNCDIRPYERASHEQHEARAPRRLLLHKKEILKLLAATQQKGLTLVATRAYWKNKKVKVEIVVGRGKTHGDQRQDLKNRVETREAAREMARFNERKGR
jgi:SsrA-binding protein